MSDAMTAIPVMLAQSIQVVGLHPDDQATLDLLVKQWRLKHPRNLVRLSYLDGRNQLKDLKAVLPQELVEQIDAVLGWPAKAVEELSNRIVLDGFWGEDQDPHGLGGLLADNRFDVEFPQAVTSALSQSVAFVTATPDNETPSGVLLQFHSALWSTGLWDRRRRALSAGLAVTDIDPLGRITRLLLLVPGEILTCAWTGAGWVIEAVTPSRTGRRIPMEMLAFQPTLERPFGRSRIDRAVMSVTDRAVRAMVRLDIHSELFSALKLILLGVRDDAFADKSRWSWLMDRMNTISKDEDGDMPKLERVSAESPEPHIAVLRQLASEFSGHTGVPLSSLGISTQNVESAQAKQEAREDIIGHAERQHKVFGAALRRIFATALMIRDGLSEAPDLRDLSLAWRPPNRPTLAALADAGAKQVGAIPGLAETSVGLELIGLSPEQVRRHLEERAGAADPLAALAGAVARQTETGGATEMKAKFDALGVAVRAGVDPDDAATRLGLDGIEFTGAVPVSLRVPEADARQLED